MRIFSLVPRTVTALSALLAFFEAWSASVLVTVVDRDGKPVANAVVAALSTAKSTDAQRSLPSQASVLQERMRFVPAVSIVAPGARVQFINNDSWEHHVRGWQTDGAHFSAVGKEGFELRLGGKQPDSKPQSAEVTFSRTGVTLLGCHIHASMRAHIYVSDTPWATLTNADGVAVLEQLPQGPMQIKVWHPDQLLEMAPQAIALGGAPVSLQMQINVVPRRGRI